MDIILYEPSPGQLEIHKAIQNPDYFFITAVIGRQWGKSTMGWNQALLWVLDQPKQIVYWVSPTDTQSQKIYHTIINAVYESGCIKSKKQGKGDTEIIFYNKSKILFRSAASEDSLRGESVNYMVLDESAFIKKTTLESILLPMLTVMGKKVLVITTPKGKNWVYDWYLAGQDKRDRHISFRYGSYDSPNANLQFLEDMKKSTNEKLFQQEYLADFVDSASVFNNIDEVMVLDRIVLPRIEDYYVGIDIGIINDASVLAILNSEGNLVHYKRWTNVEAPDLIKEIINMNKEWQFKHIYIENNNQGLTIFQELQRQMNNITDFNTNQSTKPEIINNLIHAFNMKEIKLFKDNLLRIELEAFIFKQKDGKIKFMADAGFYDDIVMALAIARECWLKEKYSGMGGRFFVAPKSRFNFPK